MLSLTTLRFKGLATFIVTPEKEFLYNYKKSFINLKDLSAKCAKTKYSEEVGDIR